MDKHERKKRRIYAQNFLIDQKVAENIVAAANISPQDLVLEIGPGEGALTKILTAKSKSVLAVEKDPLEAEKLIVALSGQNVQIVQADITTFEYLKHFPCAGQGIGDFIVVSNLPYNAATFIIRTLLTANVRPRRMIVMVQKEVADRMAARPGDMSVLGLTVQWFAGVRKLFDVPPEAFQPRPKVVSTVLEFVPKEDSRLPLPRSAEQAVFRLMKVGFASKRKKLSNNLANGLQMDRETVENLLVALGIAPTVRAEELTLQDWLDIAKNIQE